jgi:hypothetical protein
MRLPKLSAGVLRNLGMIASVNDRHVSRDGIYPLGCTTCCGKCTGAAFWKKSCAPTCTSPLGHPTPGWCGKRFPFYKACTKNCDGGPIYSYTKTCW